MSPASSIQSGSDGAGSTLPNAGDSIHGRFERIARDHPDRTAAVGPDGRATYAELNAWANAIARVLLDAGLQPEEPVALAVPRSIAQVASVLGVLKAGGAYVPLIANQPEARLRAIAASAGCRTAVAPPDYLGGVLAQLTTRIDPGTLRDSDEPNPSVPIAPDRLAYIMFTSGSTGVPKGALIEHRGVVRLVCAQHYMPFGPDFHFLYAGPLSFDLSTIEIYTPLLHGSKLLISPDDVLAPETLRRFAADEDLRGICVSFSLFRAIFEADPGAFEAIPTIGVCGEPADPRLIRRAQDRLPHARFYNAYGPTECTALTTTHQIPRPCPPDPVVVPIGIALNGMRVRVVDDGLQALPQGETGELLVGGLGVGRGYLNDPALTASRFMIDPDGTRWYRSGDRARLMHDGVIEYLGRCDDQIKVRGQRIELGEIDAALRADPAVRDAAATVLGTGLDARVGACVVAADGPFDHAALRGRLGERLMPAMVPALIVAVPELPINRNGKTDRERVREILRANQPGIDGAEGGSGLTPLPSRSPATETESALCTLIASILRRPVEAVDSGFVALGGHSLQAMVLSMRVRERWGVAITVPRILSDPSIAALAAAIDNAPAEPAPRTITEAATPDSQPRPLTPPEQRLWTIQQLDPASGVYNIAYRFRFRQGPPDRARLEEAWLRLVRRHPALRTVFSGPDGTLPTATVLATIDANIQWTPGRIGDTPPVEALRRPFDLTHAPLARLIVAGEGEPIGYLVMHHIISDAWSMEVMLRDLDALYRTGDASGLPSLVNRLDPESNRGAPPGAEQEARLRELTEQLRSIPYTALPNPGDAATGAPETARTTTASIPEDLAQSARQLAARLRVTVYAVVLAAYASWVSSLTGQDRLRLGLFVSNRHDGPHTDDVGFFVETTAAAFEHRNEPFEDAVRRAAETATRAHNARDIPFDRLAYLLAGPRRTERARVTDIFFNAIEPAPIDRPEDAARAIEIDRMEVDHGLARFGLLTTLYRDEPGWRITTAVRNGDTAVGGVPPNADSFVDHLRACLGGAHHAPLTPNTPENRAQTAAPAWDGRERRSADRVGRSGHVMLTVLSVFREVLEDPTIGPVDDFFVKGGNSLNAVRAFGLIRHRLGTSLPTATIFRHPTPERLATVIREDPGGVFLRPFLQLTDHPRERTAYILPGVTGEIISMGNLVRGFTDRWSCFAAAYPGVSEQTEPATSISDLVDRLITGLGDDFNPASAAVIGYSFGGIISYELAMRLQAQGRPPHLLVLIDTHLLARFPTPTQPLPFMTHIDNLRRLRGVRRLKYMYHRALKLRDRVLSPQPPVLDAYSAQPHIRRLNDAHLIMLQGYRPSGTYHGRVLAVNGHRPHWILPEDDDGANGWRSSLSRPPFTMRLDAGHVELVRPGAAETISRRIAEMAEHPSDSPPGH